MTTSEPHSLLHAERLRRVAEDGILLLDGVSLSLSASETVALIGPPGSGKTLLLRALAMLDALNGGDLRLGGDVITPEGVPHYRSQVIYVQQRSTLIEGTVRDNLALPFSFNSHAARSLDEDRIASRLKGLGRELAFLDRTSTDLSGGESQIVALLRAMQLNPAVLLLDEPTSSLDQQTSFQVESLLCQWMQEDGNRAMLIVTHDEAQAGRLADRIIRMDRAQIVDIAGGQP